MVKNFLVVTLVGPAQFRVVVAENENAEFHWWPSANRRLVPQRAKNIHITAFRHFGGVSTALRKFCTAGGLKQRAIRAML